MRSWIPAYAGMTANRHVVIPDATRSGIQKRFWIPAYAGMTSGRKAFFLALRPKGLRSNSAIISTPRLPVPLLKITVPPCLP